MSLLALGLVLVSAVMHATWNYLAKRVGGDMTFVWLFSLLSSSIYLPVAIILIVRDKPVFGLPQAIYLAGTCALHIVYYILLQRGYRAGDMSLVYPLSRGTGPLLSVFGAILLLGERPSPIVLVGAVFVAAGVVILTGNPFALGKSDARPAVVYGLLTGVSIAAYTLWDKQAVSIILIPPLLLTWASGTFQTILLTPYALRHRTTAMGYLREHWRAAVGIGILDTLSYVLFLTALTFSPVSNLAPVRQVSILIGAFLGARLLDEGALMRRLGAAAIMLIGLVSVAFG